MLLLDADYERVIIQLTFSPTVDVNQPVVIIIDDEIHEDSQNFFCRLLAQSQRVNISQERAMITIMDDNDCM